MTDKFESASTNGRALYYGYPTGIELSRSIKEMARVVKKDPPATQHFARIEKTLDEVARVSIEYNLIELGKRLYPPRSLANHFTQLTAAASIAMGRHLIDKLLTTLSDEQTIRLTEYLETLYVERDGLGYLVTPITADQAADLRRAIDRVRHQAPATAHIPDCSDAILALIHTVLAHWIIGYAESIPISDRGMKIVNRGTRIMNNGLNTLLSKNIQNLDEQQLLTLVDFLDTTLIARDLVEEPSSAD